MKWMKWVFVCLLVLVTLQSTAFAQKGKAYQIQNRLRFEYDDNIYQTETNSTGSFKIIEEIQLQANLNLQNTFLGIRWRPALTWWQNREPEKYDFNNDLDLIVNHSFNPRTTLSLLDTIRRGQLPELIDNQTVVRENDDFWYNTLNGTLGYFFRPQTRLEVAGRYVLLRYDEETVGDTEDFDQYVGGLTLRQQVVPETTILGELRAEAMAYTGTNRNSATYFVGGGLEQTFAPNLLGNIRGGYQTKIFDVEGVPSESSPYGDLAMTFLPSPATRLTAGAGYSLWDTDAYPYMSQQRTQVFGSLAHDITARIAMYLTGSYTMGDYTAEQSLEQEDVIVSDGQEDIIQVSARATYKINRNNWLEAGWQYTDFSSDLTQTSTTSGDSVNIRQPFDRNRLDLGWKTQF